MKNKLLIGALVFAVLSGSGGVYAGTLIKKDKTPRGNYYSVEKETIENNKYEVKLDGKSMGNTISENGNIYANIKSLPSSKYNLSYNKTKWSYNVATDHSEIDKLKLQLNQAIADVKQAQAQTDEVQKQVEELSVGKVTSTLSAKVNGNSVVVNYQLQNHTDTMERYVLSGNPCSPKGPFISVYNKGKLIKTNYPNIENKRTVCTQQVVYGNLPPGGIVSRSLELKNLPKGEYTAKASLHDYPKTISFKVN